MGVCGEDGACVDESAVIYVAPSGADTGNCERDAPCKGIEFSFSRASATRTHVVLAAGTYNENDITVDSNFATKLVIHGNGATIDAGERSGFATFIPATIRDLSLVSVLPNTGGLFYPAVTVFADTIMERVTIRAITGIGVAAGSMTARDLLIELTDPGASIGISASRGTKVTLDGATISGGKTAIFAPDVFSSVDIKNTLVYGTSKLALDVPGAAGTLDSSTIVYAGVGVASGPRALKCSSMLTVRASIIWDRESSAQAPALEGSCPLVSVIVGKHPIPGAMSLDPMFVDEANEDFHLLPNSPARDLIDTGPSYDFEGDPRPAGARFDIGADEAP